MSSNQATQGAVGADARRAALAAASASPSPQEGGDRCARDIGTAEDHERGFGFRCDQPADSRVHDPAEGAQVVGGHAFVADEPDPHVDSRTADEIWGPRTAASPQEGGGGAGSTLDAAMAASEHPYGSGDDPACPLCIAYERGRLDASSPGETP